MVRYSIRKFTIMSDLGFVLIDPVLKHGNLSVILAHAVLLGFVDSFRQVYNLGIKVFDDALYIFTSDLKCRI